MTVLYRGIHRHLFAACLFAAALGVLGAGCKKDTGPEPTTPGGETGPGSTVEISRAQDQITQARCDMEQRCNHVGQGQTYANRDACMTQIRTEWKADLTFDNCSGGVDAKGLDECLTHIRDHECGSAISNLERVAECTKSQLCKG